MTCDYTNHNSVCTARTQNRHKKGRQKSETDEKKRYSHVVHKQQTKSLILLLLTSGIDCLGTIYDFRLLLTTNWRCCTQKRFAQINFLRILFFVVLCTKLVFRFGSPKANVMPYMFDFAECVLRVGHCSRKK